MLNALMNDLGKAIENVPPADCPTLIGALEQFKTLIWTRILTAGVADQRSMASCEGKRLLTIPQVAEQLAIPKARAYELARRGNLPIVRIGKYIRIEASALATWISTHSEVQGVDTRLYTEYSTPRDRQRTPAHPKATRTHTGGPGGHARRRVKLRGAMGAKRDGDARTGRPVGAATGGNQGQTQG